MHPDQVDVTAATVASLVAAQFPQWHGLPVRRVPSAGEVWIHADLMPGSNLLVRDGRLVAVIDLEGMCVGDAVVDLILESGDGRHRTAHPGRRDAVMRRPRGCRAADAVRAGRPGGAYGDRVRSAFGPGGDPARG